MNERTIYGQEVARLAAAALAAGDRSRADSPTGDWVQVAYESADTDAAESDYANAADLIGVTFAATRHPDAPVTYYGSDAAAANATDEERAWLMLRADIFAHIEALRPGYFRPQ